MLLSGVLRMTRSRWPEEETGNPVNADERNFFKVEEWTADEHVACMIYAGNSPDRAREIFDAAIRFEPATCYTIR